MRSRFFPSELKPYDCASSRSCGTVRLCKSPDEKATCWPVSDWFSRWWFSCETSSAPSSAIKTLSKNKMTIQLYRLLLPGKTIFPLSKAFHASPPPSKENGDGNKSHSINLQLRMLRSCSTVWSGDVELLSVEPRIVPSKLQTTKDQMFVRHSICVCTSWRATYTKEVISSANNPTMIDACVRFALLFLGCFLESSRTPRPREKVKNSSVDILAPWGMFHVSITPQWVPRRVGPDNSGVQGLNFQQCVFSMTNEQWERVRHSFSTPLAPRKWFAVTYYTFIFICPYCVCWLFLYLSILICPYRVVFIFYLFRLCRSSLLFVHRASFCELIFTHQSFFEVICPDYVFCEVICPYYVRALHIIFLSK